jgi:hypothetical protein
MARIRMSLVAALTLVACSLGISSGAQGAGLQCSGTPAQYGAVIRQLEANAARAQALAEQNPIYISDVEYYAAVLAEAHRCAAVLGPVATNSR